MSIESVAIALHHSRAKGTAALVLIGIANHDGDGGAWPTMATLAKYGRCTERNAQKAVAQLEALGEVRREMQAGGSANIPASQRPNLYRFLLRCPEGCDRTSAHRVRPVDRSPNHGASEATPPVGGDTPPPVGGDTQTIPRTGPNNGHRPKAHVTTGSRTVDKCAECSAPVDVEHPSAIALGICPHCYTSAPIRARYAA